MEPVADMIELTAAAIDSALVTSSCRTEIETPAAFAASSRGLRFSRSRMLAYTRKPRLASSTADTSPKPLEQPVSKAVPRDALCCLVTTFSRLWEMHLTLQGAVSLQQEEADRDPRRPERHVRFAQQQVIRARDAAHQIVAYQARRVEYGIATTTVVE